MYTTLAEVNGFSKKIWIWALDGAGPTAGDDRIGAASAWSLESHKGSNAMRPPWKIQFAMGTLMMFVLAAATATALFAKVRHYAGSLVGDATAATDAAVVFLLATALTAFALAAWKGHSVPLAMLQVNLACLGWLILIWVVEARYERAVRYWFEAAFAAAVVLPLLVRRAVKSSLPRGPRRNWWKNACEAVSFSFLNMLLVSAGALLQLVICVGLSEVLSASPPAASPVSGRP
jgi:hypothetical protein